MRTIGQKAFNIILTGVGGQGIITLINVLDQAAFLQGYDVRSSELHGLSQRGGSVEAHVRFGKKVNSPLVSNGQADLVIALEMYEGLRESLRAGKKTKLLVNKTLMPFDGALSVEEVLKNLESKNLFLVPASNECKEKLSNEIVSTLYLLGYAVKNDLLPIKKEVVLKAIEEVIPEKYRDLNIKAFNLPFNVN